MRKRQTFLLTVLREDSEEPKLRGRVKAIATGRTGTFTSLDELYSLISSEMEDEALQRISTQDLPNNSSQEKALSS